MRIRVKVSLLALLVSTVSGYTPTNLDQPYDMTFSEQTWRRGTGWCHVGVRGEYMTSSRAYDPDEHRVAATQIWGQKESALAMLEGQAPGGRLHALANSVRSSQDGTRGMFTVNGSFEKRQAIIDLYFPMPWLKLPGLLTFGVHVPLIEASMHDVLWKSSTLTQTLDDDVVRADVAKDHESLSAFTQKYGNLDINSQHREGLGDVAAMFNWQGHFSQYGRRLRDVQVKLRAGVSIPTAHEVDINKAFDIDFGHDGAFMVPLGAGLRLDLGGGVRVGADVGVTIIGRRTKNWRLKTSWAQTHNLLLTTGRATREYGPEWKFSVFSELYNNSLGVTGTVGYQFIKHTDSTLFAQDNTLSSSLLNTSPTVEVSESHALLFNLTYAPATLRTWRVRPELMLHAKYPFNGRRMISGYIVGGGVSVRF